MAKGKEHDRWWRRRWCGMGCGGNEHGQGGRRDGGGVVDERTVGFDGTNGGKAGGSDGTGLWQSRRAAWTVAWPVAWADLAEPEGEEGQRLAVFPVTGDGGRRGDGMRGGRPIGMGDGGTGVKTALDRWPWAEVEHSAGAPTGVRAVASMGTGCGLLNGWRCRGGLCGGGGWQGRRHGGFPGDRRRRKKGRWHVEGTELLAAINGRQELGP